MSPGESAVAGSRTDPVPVEDDPVAETAAEAQAWTDDYHAFLRGRVASVQRAAQAWLGVMTTLLSLFSILVLLNQGQALGDLPIGTGWLAVLYAVAALAFGLAFVALVLGARATFGGLGMGGDDSQAGGPAGLWHSLHKEWKPDPVPVSWDRDWREYREHQARADVLRKYLHRSRILGVLAAVVVGVLSLAVLGIGAFGEPDEAPTKVVVVDRGRVYCGPLTTDAQGRVTIAGQTFRRATQVLRVGSC